MEKKLSLAEEQNAKLLKAVEQVSTSVIITDIGGLIEYVNPYFEKVTGYTLEEAKGKNPRILKSGEQSKDFYKGLWDTIRGGDVWRGEFHNKNKNGELYWEFAVISPVKNPAGIITHFVAIKEDITERKKNDERLWFLSRELETANAELKRLNQIKSDFVSTVSHELRTPLAVIKGGVAIVLTQYFGALNEKQIDFLSTAQRNAEKLARLINDVLDFHKLEARGMKLRLADNDICQAVHEAIDSVQVLARQKGLELRGELTPNSPKVSCDKDLIIQVLVNLINNAIKFTEKGSIVVRTIFGDDHVRITVTDQGYGIKAEDMSKLFEQFSQVSSIEQPQASGTGLGLAISKKIIELHCGEIGVNSVWGQGSSFYFILPTAK